MCVCLTVCQEEIKEVLEGTCKLMPIKIIREECIKVMDQFGPELVDTLASQMDPQVVCSVAGLCDNSRVHRIEAQYQKQVLTINNSISIELNYVFNRTCCM